MSRGLGRALTLGQMLDEAAARDPAHEAIVFRDERVSYGQLKARADAFALGLIALGLERGDHVVLWMPNRVEWNVAHLGIAKAGCVTVTCNSRYKALEVEYVLRQSDAKALILADRFDAAGVDYLELLREICPVVNAPSSRLPALRHVIVLGSTVPAGCRSWAEVEARGRGVIPACSSASASPGRPRGHALHVGHYRGAQGVSPVPRQRLLQVPRVHRAARVDGARPLLRPRPVLPHLRLHGGTAANCLVGSTQVVMDVFEPAEAMRLIEAERVTVFSGVPTMFITILNHPHFGRHDLRSLRTGSIGAAPVPVEIMRRILDGKAGLGMDALVVYGLTEATGGTHWTRPGDPLEKRVATVGLPTPEIEDRVVDPVTGAPVGPGVEGEVCVKGPTMMMGYYKKPEATADKLREGWLHTGDMGVKDGEGYLKITGRLTDMIIVGGFNTYPAEIENFFLRHPKVLDVSIVGVPDPIMGEAVMAFVIPKAGESLTAEEIAAFARGKIANFKVPKYVEIVDSFPLTGSGKVQKFKQRAYAVEKLDLKEPGS